MAFPRSYSDSALSADVQRDANPGANSLNYRGLLFKISSGLEENDMEKLKYLCRDLGVAPSKFESMTRGIDLFPELEKLGLITADDISLLVALMQVISRNDLEKKLKSWSSKEGNLAHKLSAYRRLMLQISDSLSPDERDQFTFYLSGDSRLHVKAKDSRSFLELLVLMEKCTLIGPGDLKYFTNIMESIGNIAIVNEIEKYLANERSSVHHVQPSSSQSHQFHQDGGVVYNTGNQSNMRSNSAPTIEGYTQNRSWSGEGNQGIPPSQQQQPCHNYPPQQYQQPQQRAAPSFNQQNPQQLQHGQQPAIKKEPADRTSSASSSLTVGPERPKWYYEAVQKHGPAYADKLFENVVQNMRENEVMKKMQDMNIAQQRRAAETTPSVKMEPGDDKREASVTRDLRLGPIEDTTRSQESEQSSTITNEGQIVPAQTATDIPHANTEQSCTIVNEGHTIVPAQTATDTPHPNTESEQSSTLAKEGHMEVPAQTATDIPHPNTDAGHIRDSLKYKMDKLPRGMCIIFNGENFTTKNLKKRDGTEKDVEALLNTFQNNLKFETQVKKDPTYKEYKECLQEIAKMDHSKFDCFVCVILSHGYEGHVYGKDGGKVSISALTGLFNCQSVHPSLVGKPKVFFIQACRGVIPQEAFPIHHDGPMVANESDILVSQSTVEGYASCRRANPGSLFIISLCDIINANYKKEDLLSMLTMTNERMSRRNLKGDWKYIGKQIGNPSHTLRKKIFFNEGLDE